MVSTVSGEPHFHALGKAAMDQFILNHLFVLKNEGNKTRQAGVGVREAGRLGECHNFTYFLRFPVLNISIFSKSEIYTKWLRLQVSKISSPILLGGHVLLGYLESKGF